MSRYCRPMGVGEPPKAGLAAAIVAGNLRVDTATAEVLRTFDAGGVNSLLLKGTSTARWLYGGDDRRAYADFDVLVRPADLQAAERLLAELGFEPGVDERDRPGWARSHGVAWLRRRDGALVDLHRTLPEVGVDPERVWLTLSSNVETLVVAGHPATALTIPGRAFHLALHAAHHGAEMAKALVDMERAVARTDEATWREAAGLAAQLDATLAFAAGVRMVPGGRRLADALALPTAQPVNLVLRASNAPLAAHGLNEIAGAKDWHARLSVVRRKVVPPAAFVRTWSPSLARHGPLGLALAYAWRPLWVLGRAPAGFMAWRTARRRARS